MVRVRAMESISALVTDIAPAICLYLSHHYISMVRVLRSIVSLQLFKIV
jgi:hypothetical protein